MFFSIEDVEVEDNDTEDEDLDDEDDLELFLSDEEDLFEFVELLLFFFPAFFTTSISFFKFSLFICLFLL